MLPFPASYSSSKQEELVAPFFFRRKLYFYEDALPLIYRPGFRSIKLTMLLTCNEVWHFWNPLCLLLTCFPRTLEEMNRRKVKRLCWDKDRLLRKAKIPTQKWRKKKRNLFFSSFWLCAQLTVFWMEEEREQILTLCKYKLEPCGTKIFVDGFISWLFSSWNKQHCKVLNGIFNILNILNLFNILNMYKGIEKRNHYII